MRLLLSLYPLLHCILNIRPLSANYASGSCRYHNESGRHFRTHLEHCTQRTDLDKTLQLHRDGEWGNSDPIKLLARLL